MHRRLDYLAETLPSTANYIEFLRRSIPYWALCHQVGHLTFNLISTAVQEGMHASFKALLRGEQLELHRIAQFFRDWFKIRRLNLLLKNQSTHRRKTLVVYEDVVRMGCEDLAKMIHVVFTDEGERELLAELQEASGYFVFPITVQEAEDAVKVHFFTFLYYHYVWQHHIIYS